MKQQILLGAMLLLTAFSVKAQPSTVKPLTKADVLVFNKAETEYRQVQKELLQLEQQKKQLLAMMAAYDQQQKITADKVEKLETRYNGMMPSDGSSQNQLLTATKQMQETQMSFNLQYLALQEKMQNENRQYTAISNIMKTKHDTAKNSISNVR